MTEFAARPLTIALYTHCYFPTHVYGTEVYVANLARAYAALGHKPVIVSATFQGEPRQPALIDRYTWDGLPVISIDKNLIPHTRISETYTQAAMRPIHRQVLDEIKPDIVHVSHLINHTTALLDACAEMNLPTYATLVDFFGFCLNNKLEAADGSLCQGPNATRSNCIACHLKATAEQPHSSRSTRLAGGPMLRGVAAPLLAAAGRWAPGRRFGSLYPADIVQRPGALQSALKFYRAAVAPSTVLREAYLANGFPAPLHLIHFGLDIDRAPKPPSPDPTKVRIGFSGQIAPHKGVHVLIEAMRLAERPNVKLTLWGDVEQDPDYVARLRQMAEGLDVTFAGRFARETVATVLAGVDLAAVPSLWRENSPQSLMEALATHTPALVSDMKGLTEFVQDGVSGFITPAGDAGALAGVLQRLGDDPDLARRLSGTTNYPRTVDMMARETARIYG